MSYASDKKARIHLYYAKGLEDKPDIKVGQKYILITKGEAPAIRHDNGGIPGNEDRHVKCYHGWRGTTNNVGIWAYGLREVLRVRETEDKKFWHYDITLSEDLHPEWD